MNNLLIYGENIDALNYLIMDGGLQGKIDLVYIDPPFATGSSFTISNGRATTISKSKNGRIAYSDNLTGFGFIEYLRERVILLHSLLSEQGSIYLHTDYKIGHYVKVMMDEIFGIENFRNDISRIKCNPKNFARIGFGNVKDMILFYTKSAKPIWNEPKVKYSAKDIEVLFPKRDNHGRSYTTVPLHAPGEAEKGNSSKPFKGKLPPVGRHWRTDVEILNKWDEDGLIEWSSTGNPRKKIFADERDGKRLQDIWEFKDPQYPCYPTEKNSDMIDLIIKTSSQENSIILDCFCGSGTSLKAAQLNRRNWIGIDNSFLAIDATKKKIEAIETPFIKKQATYDYVNLIEIKHKNLQEI